MLFHTKDIKSAKEAGRFDKVQEIILNIGISIQQGKHVTLLDIKNKRCSVKRLCSFESFHEWLLENHRDVLVM
ncbi:hypothetical protein FPZ43_01675 [Mucilaginibacter pallidiroseus]|uniref:Uncharacterized protein n=1 Tax=Mucilaginibacter pallidiroseus TaxID=2599295 RepID=A0A563UIP0_9SPHI|nr:hypothetical protein [Mucilaginibacter pallidiroseus]TWR31211.1 hypothetical protein FPZ43_01675 [Mucilaginibacter pallidiroseus]